MFKNINSSSFYLNSFILDISSSIINYIKNNNLHAFGEHFESAYNKNYFFSNNYSYRAQSNDVVETMLQNTSTLLHQFSDLDCCFSHDQDYVLETRKLLEEYIRDVLDYIDNCHIPNRLSLLSKEFQEDYAATYENLINNHSDVLEAENSIRCWQGAIADEAMHEIVCMMRCTYIKYLQKNLNKITI
jgi:hypothetical protein